MKIDEIGYWSELKLEIVKKYAAAYSTILSAQKSPPLKHSYIDGFAGAGVHIAKRTGEFIPGSPLNALNIKPPFKHHYLIDLDGDRAEHLREVTKERNDVSVYQGDCNAVLRDQVFPKVRYDDFRRALCLLDPYALNLDWGVVAKAGAMKSIEIFLNFMVMDMNMNVLWKNPEGVSPAQMDRMNRFWGDDSWRRAAYRQEQDLFGLQDVKVPNEDVAEAYRKRLKDVAGFKYVPKPLPMRNNSGAIVYFLFFASPNKTGAKIIEDIFDSYRNRGIR
jgi:three-Cys-motif partner protein